MPDATQPVPTTPPAGPVDLADTALDRLRKMVDGLLTLRVTTVIGTVAAVKITDIDTPSQITLSGPAEEVASSSINMLLGDCSTVMTKGFVENPAYAQLHKEAQDQARAVRKETMEMLHAAVGMLAGRTGL